MTRRTMRNASWLPLSILLCACAQGAPAPDEEAIATQAVITTGILEDPVSSEGDEPQECYCPSTDQDPVEECKGTLLSCPFLPTKEEDCKLIESPILCKANACGTEFIEAHTGCKWEKLVKRADVQLYHAKRAGRNQVQPTASNGPE